MTDDRTDDPTDDRTYPPEHDAVRRLLARARHTEPMPDEVAARMDATLADLAREPRPSAAEATHAPRLDLPPIVPLATHRRRKAASLILAAAAIVVGGVVVQQLHSPGSAQSTATFGAASGAARDQGSRYAGPSTPARGPSPSEPAQLAPLKTRHGLLVVRPRHFSADALAAAARLDRKSSGNINDETTGACVPASAGSHVLAVTYQRAPAALVVHRSQGSTQVVDLVLCGHSTPARSVTLPLP